MASFPTKCTRPCTCSTREESVLNGLMQGIQSEYERPIDAFSQDVLISQLDVLLNYANRFYHRQFLTRRTAEHDLLSRFETLLTAYFAPAEPQPLPTVQHFADALHVSPAYLSDMLRSLTGQNTQQHIHQRLLEQAKLLLLSTNLPSTKPRSGWALSTRSILRGFSRAKPVSHQRPFGWRPIREFPS